MLSVNFFLKNLNSVCVWGMLWTRQIHVWHLYSICVECISVVFFKVKEEEKC